MSEKPNKRPAPISIFGEKVPATIHGRIRSTTVKALLLLRKDLVCTLTSAFDGSDDSMRSKSDPVSAQWVISEILASPGSRTCVSDSLGAPVLRISDACYQVRVADGEHARRRDLIDELPFVGFDYWHPTGTFTPDGIPIHVGGLVAKRKRVLSAITDPLSFDEAIENMRRLTAFDELYAALNDAEPSH